MSTSFGGVIGISSNGGPYYVDGFNNSGNQTWQYVVGSKTWSLREIPTINTDTVKEVVGFNGFSGNVFCLDESNGSSLWTTSLGSCNNG